MLYVEKYGFLLPYTNFTGHGQVTGSCDATVQAAVWGLVTRGLRSTCVFAQNLHLVLHQPLPQVLPSALAKDLRIRLPAGSRDAMVEDAYTCSSESIVMI